MSDYYAYTNSKGTVYYLNCKEQTSAKGKKSQLYYFSKQPGERTIAADAFPADRYIEESKNGFPIVKKKKADS